MQYLPLIGTVAIIHLLAVISPGPDFIMCIRNALTYSRRTGIWTAVGFGAGISVHIFYSLAGLAMVISNSILLFNALKFLGAGYLIFIGLKSFFAKSSKITVDENQKKEDISALSAVKIGFLTNVLNPKATLFFLSLFTLVISPATPLPIMGIITTIMIINQILWFSLVAIFLTQKRIRGIFEKFQNAFNKTLGGLLIALGVKVALVDKWYDLIVSSLFIMKKMQFTVYIEQDEDGIYIGSVPSIPACHAQGKTQKEMLKNLSEVIRLCLRNENIKEIQKQKFIGIQNLELTYA